MGSGRAEKELQELIERHAEKEGLTPAVLSAVNQELKQREQSLQHLLLLKLAAAYSSDEIPGPEVHSAALALGNQRQKKEQRQLQTLAGQHQKLCDNIQQAQAEAESLQCAAQLQTQLEEFDRFRDSGDYESAAQCIARVATQSNLPASSNTEEEEQLRVAFATRGSNMATDLANQVEQGVQLCERDPPGSCQVTVSDPKGLASAWNALQILQESKGPLQKLAAKFPLAVFLPSQASLAVSTTLEQGAKLEITSNAQSSKGQTSEWIIKHSLDFVGEYILGNQAKLCQEFGKLMWEKLAAAYIQQKLEALPVVTDADFRALEQRCQAAEDLEKSIVELGFLEASQESLRSLPLHTHTGQLLNKWLHKARLELISEARDLMTHPLHDAVTVGIPYPNLVPTKQQQASGQGQTDGNGKLEGNSLAESNREKDTDQIKEREENGSARWDESSSRCLNWGSDGAEAPLFAQGRHQISQSAVEIVEVMKKGLETAGMSASSARSHSALLAMHDIAALYISIPPIVHAREMQVPLIAALYHNNCYFLAEQLLLLPHCYPGLQLPSSSVSSCTEAATNLRRAGASCLDALAEQQGGELEGQLGSGQIFTRIHEAKRGLQARKVVQQVLHALHRLGSVLREVLPAEAFVSLGVRVISCPARVVTESILSISDISVAESEDLPRILGSLAAESASTFVGPSSKDIDSGLLAKAIEQSCPALQRLQMVLRILAARLGEIRMLWENGDIQNCGLPQPEVVKLIRALFEDTDLREAVLADILDSPLN